MAYTEKRVEDALNPEVEFAVGWGGAVSGTLVFHRKKRDGSYEHVTVKFPELNVDELACIGSKARVAVYRAKEKVTANMQKAYDRIITPGS